KGRHGGQRSSSPRDDSPVTRSLICRQQRDNGRVASRGDGRATTCDATRPFAIAAWPSQAILRARTFYYLGDALVVALAQPPDETINVERWQLLVVGPKRRRHPVGMREPTQRIRKPLAGDAAVISLQLNAKVASTIQRRGDQRATGA